MKKQINEIIEKKFTTNPRTIKKLLPSQRKLRTKKQ